LARQPLHKTPCGFCQAPVIADQGIDDNFQRAGTFTKQQVTFRRAWRGWDRLGLQDSTGGKPRGISIALSDNFDSHCEAIYVGMD
jgi:hypothetical protein